eukprot:CAMPEP_0184322496 /NCGR_PEP_ID=MMETSP1049-20130417/124768_1 /TAXON_ID=77928 /ORGANISM="Proteomonas sulcata, Strain CCMP704" /LENGTH=167 /DNA_ID=CAMNT_0026643653 /DNA_START=64 /DNA_END=564 /DNA_ORIENTATION=+
MGGGASKPKAEAEEGGGPQGVASAVESSSSPRGARESLVSEGQEGLDPWEAEELERQDSTRKSSIHDSLSRQTPDTKTPKGKGSGEADTDSPRRRSLWAFGSQGSRDQSPKRTKSQSSGDADKSAKLPPSGKVSRPSSGEVQLASTHRRLTVAKTRKDSNARVSPDD